MDAVVSASPSFRQQVPDLDNLLANTSVANLDPFKFSHGFTGVDQQSNFFFVTILLVTVSILGLLALSIRLATGIRNNRRRISVIASPRNHSVWERESYIFWGWTKRYFLYAPSWTSRYHHTLPIRNTSYTRSQPTRPQTLVVVIYVTSNIIYCAAIRGQGQYQQMAELRGRCGTLAAFNLILTTLCALRNNPLIRILHISYDTFNFFHRWVARLVVLESTVHAFAFAYNAYNVKYEGRHGWNSISWVLQHSSSYRAGLAAFAAFSLLFVHSVGPLRHAFYETFLALHRLGVLIAVSGVYFHLAQNALPQLPWIYLVITLLLLESLARIGRILYYNVSWKQRNWTQVTLEALPGEATRVTFSLPRSWNANPGSHAHIYLPRIALWSSHPFSIAWSQSFGYERLVSEKHPSSKEDVGICEGPSTVSCVVRARSGMTRKLYGLALRSQSESLVLCGAVEGPYGGHDTLDSYGTVILFAAGVGITHQLSYVRHLLTGYNNNTSAAQNVLLVWCISHVEVLAWIEPWLDEMSAMQNFYEVICIRVYMSRMDPQDVPMRSVPTRFDIRAQRCDPQEVLDEELVAQVGAMAVSVCGPSDFSESVRVAVRRRVCTRSIDLFVETFSY